MVADMAANKKILADKVADMVPGHGYWLIGSKLFLPEACAVFELCEFIRTMKAYY